MKIIGFAGIEGSGRTTAVNAAAAYLLECGFTPVVEQFDNAIAQRVLAHCEAEAKEAGNPDAAWHERVILIDGVETMEELDRIKSAGGKTIFISAARRLKQVIGTCVTAGYEKGEHQDDLFDFSISNNDGSEEGLALFTTTIGPLAHKIVTSAREEIQ